MQDVGLVFTSTNQICPFNVTRWQEIKLEKMWKLEFKKPNSWKTSEHHVHFSLVLALIVVTKVRLTNFR